MTKYKIGFLGSGIIGAGLAVNALLTGHDVTVYDIINEDGIKSNIKSVLDIMVEAGACTKEAADKAFVSLKTSNSVANAVDGADFIQECVPERLELKQSVYREAQTVNKTAVIASSTSSMKPTDLQKGAIDPSKILVGHPYNPSYLLPLVEVCGGEQTSLESCETALKIYNEMGKVSVHCKKEVFGYVANNISQTCFQMAKQLVVDGVCSVEDLDKALMYGPGMRMGITGQILTISLGVQGGLANAAVKYGHEPNPEDIMLGEGVDEEIAHRIPGTGNTVDDVIKFRDKAIVNILKFEKFYK